MLSMGNDEKAQGEDERKRSIRKKNMGKCLGRHMTEELNFKYYFI